VILSNKANSSMKATTLEWIKKAEQDFSDAHAKGISVDLVCFLCQQCVEKYLKGYLEESDIPFPKIHDLDTLLNLAIPLQPLWESWRFGFKRLTGTPPNSAIPANGQMRKTPLHRFASQPTSAKKSGRCLDYRKLLCKN
jgi:hypothetical protein